MISELRELAGTVVVVTGAGSGIGAAITAALLEAGANVVAGELYIERLDGVVARWGDARIVAVAADVRSPEAAAALIAVGIDRWGRVDSVVANAGVGFFGGVLDYNEEQIIMMTETNFLGTVWLARQAVKHYRERGGGGDVILLGSVAGLGTGGGNEAIYAATKAAQMTFGTSLDREVRSEGIRVSTVAPAAVNTGFATSTGRFGDTEPEDAEFIKPADLAFAILTTLSQPRRIRTALWSIWSLAEYNG